MVATVGCHTVEMVTRLNDVTVIARRAVVMSTSKVVQLRISAVARVEFEHHTQVVLATLARHPIQGRQIGVQCQASMRLLAR